MKWDLGQIVAFATGASVLLVGIVGGIGYLLRQLNRDKESEDDRTSQRKDQLISALEKLHAIAEAELERERERCERARAEDKAQHQVAITKLERRIADLERRRTRVVKAKPRRPRD